MDEKFAALGLVAMSAGFGITGACALALGLWTPSIAVALAFGTVAYGMAHGTRVYARAARA